jgi:hypothetical protein
MATRNPLLVVEQRLGDVDTWPSHSIGYIFLEFPTDRIIKRLTAFFYGNGISLSLAVGLYEICNSYYTSLVGSAMRTLYWELQSKRFTPQLSQYYDIHLRQFLWINGSSLHQRDVVQPIATVIDYGYEECFPTQASVIGNKLLLRYR